MFGLGLGEITIILLLALIVLGPKRLPEVGKKIGEFYHQFRDAADTMRSTITGEFEDSQREERGTKDAGRSTQVEEHATRDAGPIARDDQSHEAD